MKIKKEYDAIIIGGGNMGLTLGAYLQRSGMDTAIFERRHEEGSAIFTSECTSPGFMHNLHAQYMEFIDWMPIYYDFNLEQLGARCIFPMPSQALRFQMGDRPSSCTAGNIRKILIRLTSPLPNIQNTTRRPLWI